MSQAIARSLLLKQLKTVEFVPPAGTDAPKITSENVNYQAGNRQPFVRFTFVPSETQVLTIAGYGNPLKRHQGQAMISLFVPRGTGVNTLYKWADEVMKAFPASTALYDVDEDERVRATCYIRSSWAEVLREEADWAQLIVAVRWYLLEQQLT